VARKKKSSADAPTSIRLSADLKEALREEGRREQKEHGGPPRSLHYVIITVLRDFVERRREQRAARPI
jgi:predicted transcriptional regulator